MMAYFMMDQEKFEEAKNHLNIYLTVHPDEPNAYDSMGDLLLQMGDTLNAKEMFFKAYEVSRTLASGPEDFFNTSKDKGEALH